MSLELLRGELSPGHTGKRAEEKCASGFSLRNYRSVYQPTHPPFEMHYVDSKKRRTSEMIPKLFALYTERRPTSFSRTNSQFPSTKATWPTSVLIYINAYCGRRQRLAERHILAGEPVVSTPRPQHALRSMPNGGSVSDVENCRTVKVFRKHGPHQPTWSRLILVPGFTG